MRLIALDGKTGWLLLPLIEPCILAGSRPGDSVLDPFLGRGTTAEVAQRLDRRWLGIELNPDDMQEHCAARPDRHNSTACPAATVCRTASPVQARGSLPGITIEKTFNQLCKPQ